MIASGRLEWRRTAVDPALALLVLLVLLQLALGPGPLASWALGPPGDGSEEPPAMPLLWAVGTVSPTQTVRSLLLFLTYASAYLLTVQLVRRRSRLLLLVRVLLGLGAVLAFAGLLDYVSRGTWLALVREPLFPTRLTATFVNPDHFAAWLNMLICLGIGDLLTRSRRGRRGGGWQRIVASREAREDAIRRYLPFVGLGLMALALVFTLSRGGIVSLLAALLALLGLAGALGRLRWSLVTMGALLAVMLAVGAWIGLGPVVARFQEDTYRARWTQATSSLGMVAAHPVLGVGLGAYRDAYRRFQPSELKPGQVFYPHAHNDWLQLVIEMGAVGALIALWGAARLARDLVGAHLLGRGRCPVGAGEDEGAQRHDLASVGLGLGGLAGALSLGVHSLFDFGARIPANGVLAAACLAIATVSLHTRFAPGGGRVLSWVRARALAGGARGRAVVAALAIGAVAAAVPVVVSPALADGRLRRATADGDLALADLAVRSRPRDPDVLALRSRLRVQAAERAWSGGLAPDGRLVATWAERRTVAGPLIAGGLDDLRAAVAARPTDPLLQEQLAWAHLAAADLDAGTAAEHKRAALAAMGKSVALAPENPYLRLSLALVAVGEPAPQPDVALRAGREAVLRDPALTQRLVEHLLPLGLHGDRWLQLVPDAAAHRLALGAALEAAGLEREAVVAYRAAAGRAAPALEPAARWLAARLLIALGDRVGAVSEMEAALARAPDHPELHLALGRALAADGDPRALDAYRRAVVLADARAGRPAEPLFATGDAGADALVARRLGPGADASPVRYRRALGEYLLARRLWQPALRIWDEVLAERPDEPPAHFARGVALYELGERTPALEALRRAVTLAPRAAAYRLRLADALWTSEQYHQAINEWREVVGMAPGDVEARLRLAAAYDRVGQPLDAHRERRRALDIAPAAAARALDRVPPRPRTP